MRAAPGGKDRKALYAASPWGAKSAGFTLVELMIALVLGLVITAAVSQVYLASKQSFRTQDQNAIVQENGRFALEFMARDVRMAGYLGCGSRGAEEQIPVRSYLNSNAWPYSISTGIFGYEASGSNPGDTLVLASAFPAASGSSDNWSPALPSSGSSLTGLVVPGSDVLVLSGMGPDGVPLVAPFTSGSQVFVATPNDIAVGDILLVSDCQQAQLFQATNVNTGGDNVVGSNSGAVSPGNFNPISERGPVGPFQQGSEIARVRTYAYYVGVSAVDGSPALFRQRLGSGSLLAEELISGIDSMQVLYGIDSNLDFVVDDYVTANAIADWAQVRAARVALLVRTPEEILPAAEATSFDLIGTTVQAPQDRRQRRVFVSTFALRNRLL